MSIQEWSESIANEVFKVSEDPTTPKEVEPIEKPEEETTPPTEVGEKPEIPQSNDPPQDPFAGLDGEELDSKVKEVGSIPYSRWSQVNERMKEAEKKLKELQTSAPEPEYDDTEAVAQTLKKMGFLTVEELEAKQKQLQQQVEHDVKVAEAKKQLEKELESLEGKHPDFNRSTITKYMQETGIVDPEAAFHVYQFKHQPEPNTSSLRGNSPLPQSGKLQVGEIQPQTLKSWADSIADEVFDK